MNASIGFFLCFLVGSAFGYNVQGDFGYNNVPNGLYSVGVPNYVPEQSQRLFWGNQGSNQVGGTGWWAALTNKFPFLNSMFGRMELPTQYGAPNQYVSPQYAAPNQYVSPQNAALNQYVSPQNAALNQYVSPQNAALNQYVSPQHTAPNQYVSPQYAAPGRVQTQFFRSQQSQFAPGSRDVGFTDDAVIVTPPQVPIVPLPAPAPAPVPSPAPIPAQPDTGYQYNKPQYRLQLPRT